MAHLAWVDLFLMVIVGLSILVGVVRGFVFEVMSLVGWFVAAAVARWLSPQVSPHLAMGEASSALQQGVSFVGVFVAALVVWSLICRLVRMALHATPLSVFDRLLGGVFGGVRGVLVVLLFALAVNVTPLTKTLAWRSSQLAPWLQVAVAQLKPVLPAQLSQHLPP